MLPLWNLRSSYMGLMETMIMEGIAKPKNAEHNLYLFAIDVIGIEEGELKEVDLWAEANLFLTAGQCSCHWYQFTDNGINSWRNC